MISLSACDHVSGPVLTGDLKSEIKAKIRAVCGKTLSNARLEKFANLALKYRNDADVIDAISYADEADQMARICRGMK